MNFDVVFAQNNGAIELTEADLQSVYGGNGGSDTSLGVPINVTDLEVLDLLGHILGPVSSTLGSTESAGSAYSRSSRSSKSSQSDDED